LAEFISEAYYKACIAVIGPDGKTIWGSGVAIGGRKFLTCAHVVARALNRSNEAPAGEVKGQTGLHIRQAYVVGPDVPPAKVRVAEYWSRGLSGGISDIALVELINPTEDQGTPPPRFAERVPKMDERLFIVGFPESAEHLKSTSDSARYLARDTSEIGWLNTRDESSFGSEIRPGFSGAPVWSFDQGAVVGIITEADRNRRTAAVVPNRLIRQVVELPNPVSSAESVVERPETPPELTVGRPGIFRRMLDQFTPRLHLYLTDQLGWLALPAEREALAGALRTLAVGFESEIKARSSMFLPGDATELPSDFGSQFRPIPQLIREIVGMAEGGDAADAMVSALSKRSTRVADLMRTLRHSPEPIIVLGDPGSGKSLTLQQLAIAIARREEKRVFPSVCIFVRLGRWIPVPELTKPDGSSVRALIDSVCPPGVRPYLADLERRGRLTLIFDGMDEMSRIRYVEHTAALSTYAGEVAGRVQTLFSCRIADFTPNFHHRRLVLLPFDRRHIRLYLQQRFLRTPIEVEGEGLTARELASRLTTDDLPVRATNPYVLYLLSVYIAKQKAIPRKRTDLLHHYFQFAIDRKKEDLRRASLPADWPSLFDLWGQIGMAITEANQGAEIRRTEIALRLGGETAAAIGSAFVAGVLVESPDLNDEAPPFIRFESHRAQEFFTAWHIAQVEPDFDWGRRLDVPRWQETLVNVAQLGKAGGAIAALEQTLRDVPFLLN